MTQYQILLKHIEGKDWIVSYQLEKINTPWGFLGTSSLKRCRELVTKGLLEKKMEGGYVHYRIPRKEPVQERLL